MVKLLYQILIPILICFIAASSIYMHKTPHTAALLISGSILFILIVVQNSKKPYIILQFAALFVFHYFSHLNWCYTIYILLLAREILKIEQILKCILLAAAVIFVYSSIRLSYSEINAYTVLVTFTDWLSVMFLLGMIRYIANAEVEKKTLRIKNNELLRFDHLTGLQNYVEFRKNFVELLAQKKKVCLIIVDCYNIKKLNAKLGYAEVDRTLKTIADQIAHHFQDAIISRYSGGEFALAFEYLNEEHTILRIKQILDEKIPKATNVELLYAVSFAQDGDDHHMITNVEKSVFQQKKELLYKEEEHLFRADKLKMIGELAAGMAHEIRNPLTTIKGFLQIASKDDFSNIGQYYPHIMDEISRVSELTSEFLQFSRPHISQYKVEDVFTCIKRAVSITQTEAEREGHSLRVEKPESPLYIRVDRDKIVQVLINLIKNALEAMTQIGSILIKTYAWHEYVVIKVCDNGPGIPQAVLDKLFTPFFTTKSNGTGLGLAISHKIISDHEGKIEVKSKESEGTAIKIYLPAAELAEESAMSS